MLTKKQIRLTRDGVVIDHSKKDGIAGLISVLGVKYTTARAVAEQAVDLESTNLALTQPSVKRISHKFMADVSRTSKPFSIKHYLKNYSSSIKKP